MEKRFIRKDGQVVHATISVKCVHRTDGSIDYFVALMQDITDRKRAEQLVQRMAFYDHLTDLPNRNALTDHLEKVIQSDDNAGLPMALILFDIDHFKEINNTLGHRYGDQLLKEVGIRLRNVLFVPDIVARLAGDEFAVLLPKLARKEDIDIVIQNSTGFTASFIVEDCRLCWRRASASHCIPSMGIIRTACCSGPMWRCTRPKRAAAARPSMSRS